MCDILENQRVRIKSTKSFPDRKYSYPETITSTFKIEGIVLTIHQWDKIEPHIHFYRSQVCKDNIRSGGAISLLYPCYYQHDGNHREKLSKEDMDKILLFLNSPSERDTCYTNWEIIISDWNIDNPDGIQIPDDYPIPEYHYDMGIIVE